MIWSPVMIQMKSNSVTGGKKKKNRKCTQKMQTLIWRSFAMKAEEEIKYDCEKWGCGLLISLFFPFIYLFILDF